MKVGGDGVKVSSGGVKVGGDGVKVSSDGVKVGVMCWVKLR